MEAQADKLSIDEMIQFLEACRDLQSIAVICCDVKRRRKYNVKEIFMICADTEGTSYPAMCVELDGCEEFDDELRSCAERCEAYVDGEEDWESGT